MATLALMCDSIVIGEGLLEVDKVHQLAFRSRKEFGDPLLAEPLTRGNGTAPDWNPWNPKKQMEKIYLFLKLMTNPEGGFSIQKQDKCSPHKPDVAFKQPNGMIFMSCFVKDKG